MELRTDRYKLKELFPDKANKYAQKLHIKADNIDFIRKGIPIEPKDITIEEGERAAIRYITTPRLDRDSEILIPEGAMLDDFRQSPSVLYGHDYKGRLPIGKDIWIKTTKRGILAKTQYATHQFAEDLFQCVKGGFLNSNSVGFIPVEGINLDENKDEFVKWQDILEMEYGVDKEESGKAKTIYTKWIMLEHSDVPVASNAQSLNVLVSKGDLPIKSKELLKDLEVDIEVEDFQEEVEIENEVQTMTPEELKEHYRGLQEVEVVGDEKEGEKIKDKTLEDYEYLLHHIEIDDGGKEEIHHCYLYDHIANLFEQAHLVVMKGRVYLDGKKIKDGVFHVIVGLESTQEVAWSDEEARENKITPKKMKAGMTLKKKSKEW